MKKAFPDTLILAETDDLAHEFCAPVNGTHPTAWDSWHELQARADLTACGEWMPTSNTPGWERTWDVRSRPGFAQKARFVRIEGERALYRGEDDGNFYWVNPPPTRSDTDRYPTKTLRGRRAEYWGHRDPADFQ